MKKKSLKNNGRKGVTPIIATIILIAGTLVLALEVGAYTFGLFGSNARTVQLTSALLTSGAAAVVSVSAPCTGANFQLTFNNPGDQTFIKSISLSAGGEPVGATYYISEGSSCNAVTYASGGAYSIVISNGPGQQATPYVGAILSSSATYSYVITFGNGQSISGTIISM